MQLHNPLHDRRRFLRLAVSFSTGALLAGCGSDDGEAGAALIAGPLAVAAVPAGEPAVDASPPHPLNLALTLSYIGGQYHAVAAHGMSLAAGLTAGTGRIGAAIGGRRVAFADPMIAAFAEELAEEKALQVATLRNFIGSAAPAQPPLDLSDAATGPFSLAAQRAGIVAAEQAFDPYANDDAFLLGALLIDYAGAATFRTLLLAGADETIEALAATQLAEAIYHGGLIRALLDARASADPAIGAALARMTAMLATLDGSDAGNQRLSTNGASVNLLDAENRPIPFTRSLPQVLSTLYLSHGNAGGFLPKGANGIG